MSEHLQQLREKLSDRRRDALQGALTRAAAHGLAARGEVPQWIQDRLSPTEEVRAHSIAEPQLEYIDAILNDEPDSEKPAA